MTDCYTPISRFFQSQFGGKVYKLPLTIAGDCPNRKGLKGMKICTFCDEWGASARSTIMDKPLSEQITQIKTDLEKRNALRYIAYFQSYTSTFLELKLLEDATELVMADPAVVGVIYGTRPDCLSQGLLDYWKSLSKRTYVQIELGVQTLDEEQLIFLSRGHTAIQSQKAIKRIQESTGLDVGVHLMFGLPGETDQQMTATAHALNGMNVHNVKLHHLHVLKNTPLERQFREGAFEPITRELYAQRVRIFLESLDPKIYVQRLAA
ncbi:MAG: TIGR01212 family radical SAM protein, partial [Bdellovibrionales bacterium]|nr:TIGR01212 family radical SAM protein [Bdellovibrionales bacterium]